MSVLDRGRSAAPAAPSAGRVGRRRALPTGRAVAGGFFVAVAAVLVFAAWLSGTGRSGTPWVVATRQLPAGARLQAGDLSTESMTLPARGAARLSFRDPQRLVGKVLAAPLVPGELVQTADLAPDASAPALRPVTVDVAPADVVDVTVGATVDVLVTDGSDPSSPTSVVVTNARVLDVGQPSNSLVAGSTGAQISLGVSTLAQVTGIVHAEHTGTLSVVVGAPGDRPTPGAGTGSTGTSSTAASSTPAGSGG